MTHIKASMATLLGAIREMAGHDVEISVANVYEGGRAVAAIFLDGMIYDEEDKKIILNNWETAEAPGKTRKKRGSV